MATVDASQAQPSWREEIILWKAQLPSDNNWRHHDGLQGKFDSEYPDDLEVLFPNLAAGEDEVMWVHVIAYDAKAQEYLGILLNHPDLISTIHEGDNVAFKLVDGAQYPVALEMEGNYERAGLPAMAPAAFSDAMALALNQYRRGAFGHNMAGIESAIGHFHRCKDLVTDETGEAALFFLHFFLARCFAEKYETLASVKEFQLAISLRPDDENAQMALLAELSVLAHTPAALLLEGDPETWAQRFEAQVDTLRNRFPPDAYSNRYVEELLNEGIHELGEEAGLPSREDRERIQRIGSGPFRFKIK